MARKDVIKNEKNVNEIIFYLKKISIHHTIKRRTFIEDIPSQEDQFTFEATSDSLKAHSNVRDNF